jgi:hypothetical protein
MPGKRNDPEMHRSWLSFIGTMFAHTVKQGNCPFLNSFIANSVGTVRVAPATHIGTVSTKINTNPNPQSWRKEL